MKLSVILPTYNERGNIVILIRNIIRVFPKTTFEILVVDDNSSDGTVDTIKKAFGHNAHVRVWVRRTQRGLATAIWYGISRARGEYIVVMDTDLSHEPKLIPAMLRSAGDKTMVIGSRYIHGGGMEDKLRNILSHLFNIYLRFLFRIPVTDFLSGYFCAKTSAIQRLGRMHAKIFTGYGDYFMRLITTFYRSGGRFIELPSFYRTRPYGVTKSKFIAMFITYTRTSWKIAREQKLR